VLTVDSAIPAQALADIAGNVQTYRVTVNHYSLDKGGL